MNCAEAINGYFWFGLVLGLFLGHLLSGWLFHNRRKNDAHSQLPDSHENVGTSQPGAARYEAPVSAASATEIGADQ